MLSNSAAPIYLPSKTRNRGKYVNWAGDDDISVDYQENELFSLFLEGEKLTKYPVLSFLSICQKMLKFAMVFHSSPRIILCNIS